MWFTAESFRGQVSIASTTPPGLSTCLARRLGAAHPQGQGVELLRCFLQIIYPTQGSSEDKYTYIVKWIKEGV